ncbi:MAG: carbohydrate ABC transporter permease [Fimbriimonadaceae bacterium]|uniref:Carbohydrate ABC transporter membrane protein 2,CUT1 family n=1 Tax=Candidatus Nitrosymbiomonas proteolyticus TaxID=2608984 RepID=A0A809R5U3_9BACT|nr:MAG: carbohydrate ABC transporter membrane protein 2,CUT1 family [Armatimonadetes bacterium OLB18]MCK6630964.1 carbohydrate ABC transporter permease [Fimbriimonadaceae bacterium]NUM38199.1 carbohydrate ABC transporter permease [Armatimonadota bacterium]QOJ11420.1 MAG: carbohydrate ABC transporter permease [Chthonomonadaceae bacterium]BBO22943.1 carbohydrate ABC transporter membrane protein 2,CUT1 family [Candidatus Nitrosymbiomonas proteolyticus]
MLAIRRGENRQRSIGQERRQGAWLIHALLLTLSALFLMPLLWMISTSLKDINQAVADPPVWIPDPVVWQNYPEAVAFESEKLGYIPFLVYARNTLLICVLTVAGSLVANSLVAYSFAKLRWKGRDVFFAATLGTMMIPFPVVMVPTFGLFRALDWIGTFRPLWVPAWFGTAFSIFLLRQFFRTIPEELSEAARLDGGSEWHIYSRVVMPLSKPALAVVALFTFMASWNDFLGPLIYLLHQYTFTLSLGLQFFQSQQGATQWHLLMAASTVIVTPVIVLFFLAQRYFIQGIALTGLKG